jgi:hypothetical protein
MALSVENAGAFLVPGRALSTEETMQALQTKKVRVLRAFTDHTKKVVKVGDTVELPKVFALEMIAANKAAPVEEPAPVAKEPEPKKSSDKEARNAR